jgi:hypothetical protein
VRAREVGAHEVRAREIRAREVRPREVRAREVRARARDAWLSAWTAFTGRALVPYQAAIVRIGIALCFGSSLLREWPNRRMLFGDRAAWSLGLERQMLASNHAFTILAWSGNRWWFECVYAAAILVSVLFLLGWHTRATSVLFMVAVLSLQNRDVLLGDGGDNVVHLMAIYLAFTRCGQVWSLDARRRRRPEPAGDRGGVALWAALGVLLGYAQWSGFAKLGMLGPGLYSWRTVFWSFWLLSGLRWWLARRDPAGEPRALVDALGNMLHNCAMLIVAAQVCFIYATAGWNKVQGSLWQHGSAVYYPLHWDYVTPWPGLSQLLSAHSLPIVVISYGTVIIQVGFPFLVFNRRIKNALLVPLIAEHVAIGVLLGLPFFALAMIAADAVFLPTSFLVWSGRAVANCATRA